MKPVTQKIALEATPLNSGENAQFWRAPRFDGLECLAASFRTHVYEPHTHDTFVVGGILSGCQCYWQRGQQIFAGPGDLVFVNPFELHDGIPEGYGYTYRMTYPSISLLQKIAEDLTDKPQSGTPYFPEACVHDPELCQEFVEAHKSIQNRSIDLEAEEPLYMIFAKMLAKHGSFTDNITGSKDPVAITRAREYLEESFMGTVHLDDLVNISGRSKYHLIRSFKKATGQTPHAYLTDVRVRNARRLLVRGTSPSETASLCGFADQAHLTRQFKSRVGTTPAAFQRSVISI
ncbi:AraC family ligand binding domain-containing protein [Pseudovibrio ascidiaceicola]|jgi:AraC-like DNA-binding protein|uniref:AraC-type DNA-binding protein n=1 Tax=Pseudovibrio ascidiaceicola TaxID=285279 RepID=A0A1I3XN44_9HYPH|nr:MULTISPECIES: AraC family transcriptional regulator [Pseudovibrio]KZK94768.1 Bifunctional transcriptional activator/DNA repair enzyme AdaA [Pseudovibrio sp. W74]KZL04673.1 Bifunctional transcriptional activator/DNA repair enzyme AdaA [Pseudovibrio sp. Ad14]SFK21047.1 AraC-type DNA-binding protein [Pseudovibrio ascidiaceicola]